MLGNRRSDFKFSDKQMQFNHDIRVWICGAEVTDHLRGSINLRRGDRNGPSTVQFDLDNVNDIFVITAANKGYIEEGGRYEKNPVVTKTQLTDSLTPEAKKRIDAIYKEINELEDKLQDATVRYDKDIAKINEKYETDYEDTKQKLELASQSGNEKQVESLQKKLQIDLVQEKENATQLITNDYEKTKTELENKLSVARKRAMNLTGNITKEKDADGNYVYNTTEIGSFGTQNEEKTIVSRTARYKHKNKKIECRSEELIFKTYNDSEQEHIYSDSAKKTIFTNKVILNANINLGGLIKGEGFGFKPYALSIDTPIIEKHDPMRVFIKDPSSPFLDNDNNSTYKSKWVPLFSGFVDTVADHSDYTTGDKFLSISCYDIRGMMQRMRVMTNPRISRGTDTARERAEQAKKFSVNTGYFQDFIAHGGLGGVKSTKYLNYSFDQVCLEFLTGRWHYYKNFAEEYVGKVVSSQSNEIIDNNKIFDEINKSTTDTKASPSLNGIGTFIPGVILECPRYDTQKEKCIQTMELWYDILVFGMKATYYDADEMERIGNSTLPYGEFDPYNCFVHMITPPSGTPARNLFDSQLEDLQTGFDYENRFEFMSKLVERLDYQWFTNSMGDIVIEFPMYDFTPEVFGKYEDNLTIDNHLVSTVLNEVADTVFSAVAVTGGVQSITGNVMMSITPMCFTAFAKSDLLAYKYGININEVSAGHLTTNTNPELLRNQAIIELIKSCIAVSSMEMEVVYRFAIFPNKPVKNVVKHRLATVTGFSYSMQINESVSCTIDTAMVKKQNEDNSFITIFNAPNMPIKYLGTNAIDVSNLQAGIDAFFIGTDGKPASNIKIK